MSYTGRCYCGDLKYEFDEPIHSQLLCYCRECRYLSGGEANASIVISENSFRFTKGTPKTFKRGDLEKPRIRFSVVIVALIFALKALLVQEC